MIPSLPGVFPAPRAVDLSGSSGSLRIRGEALDPQLPAHGYRLRVETDGVMVEHRDEAGRRYALDTVSQLAAAPRPVGTGVVQDWPTFTERAFMLDISRDRVPTTATLEWLVDLLGRLRYTELQLYTEHTFAWRDHEEVWRDASPLTPDELSQLAGCCRRAGLRVVPCLNGFGHMERFLRHERYRHRAECPDGAPALFGDGLVPPTTLAPTPANAEFALALFREVLAALPSDRVHAGGDEPFELGRGRSADAVRARGRSTVYAEHLARLLQPLVDDGLEALFWGDVLVRAPEQLRHLPQGSTAVAWWYEAPVADPPPISRVLGPDLAERLGLPEDALVGFAAHTRGFADAGFPFWVAPGTSSWNSLVGRWPNARANIDDAVDVGAERGARGFLLTDWGDNGHHQPLPVSLPAIVHAAGAAWCAGTHDATRVPAEIDRLPGTVPGTGDLLVALGSVDDSVGVRQFNGGALHAALLGRLLPPKRHQLDVERVGAADEVLQRAVRFDGSAAGERGEVVTAELRAAARLARVGLGRLAGALGVEGLAAEDVAAVDLAAEDLADAIDGQRAAWLRSSRPGGLADSLARLHPPAP